MSENLKFSPDILRHLGEELVPNLDQSVIELVKNAYDADATECTVELLDTDLFGGSIVVHDNGSGMGGEDISKGWLLIGRSRKQRKSLTPIFGRIPVGDKGLGRLSALRLGTRVKLITRPRSEPGIEYTLAIDWDKFDASEIVEDVPLEIIRQSTSKGHGTEIEIRNLRRQINRNEVDSLAKSIILLTGPFEFNNSFKAELRVPEFKELENKVRNAYFDDATFRLVATVNEQNQAHFQVFDWKGELLWAEFPTKTYNAVPAKFELWAFILDQETFTTRQSTKKEVQQWLQACGGVYLFEGGMRVPPYGGPGQDWLDMNLSRARSPELRPSTNTAIGRVVVDNRNSALIQKTDRFGYIENEHFHSLKELAKDALNFMATKRLEMREQRRQETRAEIKTAPSISEKLDSALEKALPEANEGQRAKIKDAVTAVIAEKEKETISLKEDLQLYRSLATAGMTSAVFAHEIGKPLGNIEFLLSEIYTYVEKTRENALKEVVALTTRSINKLKRYVEIPLTLLKKEKRKAGKVEIYKTIEEITELFLPILEDADIKVSLSGQAQGAIILGSRSLIDGIFANLFSNSINAFQRPRVNVVHREISIEAVASDGIITIRYDDNAGGITDINIADIWLPGVTSTKNGTGLGLTIVKDSLGDLGGTISAQEIGPLGGAQFTITLPTIS